MDSPDGLVDNLRRLDAAARDAQTGLDPGFDYGDLMARDLAGKARARRRAGFARGTASALVLAMVAVTVWRLGLKEGVPLDELPAVAQETADSVAQPRMVRADTYLAVVALEDHIASIDDALNDARLSAPRGADVARLERTRAELMDSYTRVRYAEMVSANF